MPGWFATALLSSVAAAQAPLGNWVHPGSDAVDVFVSTSGNNAKSGLNPAEAVQTLDVALGIADTILAMDSTSGGVTINVFPGSYAITQPLSVPAFGVSIEPYRDTLGGSAVGAPVVLDNSTGIVGPTAWMIAFDRALGPLTAASGKKSSQFPPSVLRGLTLLDAGSGAVIEIDPSNAATGLSGDDVIEVEVRECVLGSAPAGAPQRGIRVTNFGSLPNPYRNVLEGNQIGGYGIIGIEIRGEGFTSDIVRGNSIVGGLHGIAVTSSVDASRCRPRIQSNFIRDQNLGGGIFLTGSSAQIVGNTIANVTGMISPLFAPGSIVYNPSTSSNAATLVIANNLLFSPGVPEVDLITFGAYTGTLVFDSNDLDASDPPAMIPPGPGTVLIAAAGFVGPADLHLVAGAPSTLNPGNQAFVLPGAGFQLNGTTLPSNVPSDADGDPRTHQPFGSPAAVLHRGADQRISDGIRLRFDTSAGLPLEHIADRFGNVVPDTTGATKVALALDVPPGAFYLLSVCSTLPGGPDFQHGTLPPFGSFSLDPSSSTVFDSGFGPTGGGTVNVLADFGVVVPPFVEAETYIQGIVLRPDSTGSFTNRLRVDFDRL